ncbi:MAG: SAM-dependent methyltransferase [Dehalococcoidia bacterium]|nr:SAM-dependent methyltransferase [Dehalococcoidia bacterium]
MPLFRRKPPQHREPQPGPFVVEAIGHVRNGVAVPRPRGWEKVESEIALLPVHAARIAGIEAYSHIIVVFVMDLAAGAPEKPEALTLASGNRYGIFATRSQLRPNHIGLSAVPLLSREGTVLRVRGLDAIDGTAVIDIKPYLPAYDAWPGARIPPAG